MPSQRSESLDLGIMMMNDITDIIFLFTPWPRLLPAGARSRHARAHAPTRPKNASHNNNNNIE